MLTSGMDFTSHSPCLSSAPSWAFGENVLVKFSGAGILRPTQL